MSQNFGFVSLPDELTTGSSIMPHKKNPDVFELVRSHCNRIQAVPSQITLMINNLPSGYFRDLQIIKEIFIPLFKEMNDCLKITTFAISNIKIKKGILDDDRYRYVFSVEDVNRLVQKGVPFRDAYKQVGMQIEAGEYMPSGELNHTHEGSLGNLCLSEIKVKMDKVMTGFQFSKVNKAIDKLLGQKLVC
jgi:argininosuccinate lyase